MIPDQQPSIDQLQQAWTHAIDAEGIGGAMAETRAHLQKLRDMKTTWIGANENELRLALDRYLDGRPL